MGRTVEKRSSMIGAIAASVGQHRANCTRNPVKKTFNIPKNT